jgi:hypothetical protein
MTGKMTGKPPEKKMKDLKSAKPADAATAQSSGVEPLLFVDAIEDGHARLVLDGEAFTVPTRLLPAAAREGTWLRLSLVVTDAPPSDADAIRKKLARDDPGGPLKL